MTSPISSTSTRALAANSSSVKDPQIAALEKQLRALQKQLKSAQKDTSGESAEKIKQLQQQIAQLETRIAQLKAAKNQDSDEAGSAMAAQSSGQQPASSTLGVNVDEYA